MPYPSVSTSAVILVALFLGGCVTCMSDEDCLDGASLRYRTTAPGPYEVQLCIDGTCSDTVSVEDGPGSYGGQDLGGLPGVQWARAWARVHDERTTDVQIDVDILPTASGVRPPPADYRVVLMATDGTAIDETLTLEYEGHNPAGELCGGSRCWRDVLEREL